MRGLRSEQGEQEGSDFVTVLNACQKKYFPAADLHDWPARYNTIKRLAEDMVKEFRKKAPVQANQTLLTRLQALESENAGLKSQSSRSTRTDPTPNHHRREGTPKPRSAPQRTEEKQLHSGHLCPLMNIRLTRQTQRTFRIQDRVLRRTRVNSTSPNQTVFVSLRAATLSPPLVKELMLGWPRLH